MSGLGYSFDTLEKEGQAHPFATSMKLLHSRLIAATTIEQLTILPLVDKWNPRGRRFQRWFMSNLTWGTYRQLSDVVGVMEKTASEIYESRKKELQDASALSESGKDILTTLSEYVPASTDVMVSLMGCNRNVELWGPDAGEWKPERWLNELPPTLTDAKIPWGLFSSVSTHLWIARYMICGLYEI